MWKPLSALGIAIEAAVGSVYVGEARTWWRSGEGDRSLIALSPCGRGYARLAGGSAPEVAQLASPSVSLMPPGARNPPQHGWQRARLGWASRLSGTFLWEEPCW